MDDDGDRTRTDAEPRGDGVPEWEVFFRDEGDDPLRHVGSVSAPTAETAHEHAATLFGDSLRDVWICRSDDVERFSTYSLSDRATDGGE